MGDVTDALTGVQPRVAAYMPSRGSGGSLWRDVKTYKNWAYVVADKIGDHGMQAFKLARLVDIDTAGSPVQLKEDYVYDGVGSAHYIHQRRHWIWLYCQW